MKPKLVSFTLVVIILISALFSFYQYRFAAQRIDKIAIDLSDETKLHPLDVVLLEQIDYLRRQSVFDSQFSQKQKIFNRPEIYVATCPVTQQQFNGFLHFVGLNNLLPSIKDPTFPKNWQPQSSFARHKILGRLKTSVSGVNFYDALAFCNASGGRLPTNQEWEAIANGSKFNIYPWGNSFKSSPWKLSNPILNAATRCNNKLSSEDGVQQMGFAMSEWTKGENGAILKGGNAYNKPYSLHSLNFVSKEVSPLFRSQFVGFRCVYEQATLDKNNFHQTPWGDKIKLQRIKKAQVKIGLPETAQLPQIFKQIERKDLSVVKNLLTNKKITTKHVSKYEISVAQYRSFLNDPLTKLGFYGSKQQPKNHSYVPDNWQQQLKNLNLPVVNVSWWDADAFARWAGGRLPSHNEWVTIFGGKQKTIYPWGNSYQVKAVSRFTSDTPLAITDPRHDVNDIGVHAMAGNVSEWTSSVALGRNDFFMIVKGGNYIVEGKESNHVAYIAKSPAYHRSARIGIRLVFD